MDFVKALVALEDGGGVEVSAKDIKFGRLLVLADEAAKGGGILIIDDSSILSRGEIATIAGDGGRHVICR
jgi:hypothetical protein